MPLADRLRLQKVPLQAHLQFCNSRYGPDGRMRMRWYAPDVKSYSDKLKEFGPIRNECETNLHSFLSSDLQLTLDNVPADPALHGFWDGDYTSPVDELNDLSPVEDILARVSISAQESDGSWSGLTPVFTGIVDEVVTDNDTGTATMTLLGFGSFLAGESAEDVKTGDSWYSQISINRAIRLLLTQKDRWVPAYADNVSCYVVGVGTSTMMVQRYSGTWQQDTSGQHPNGVLSGYCVVLTSGTANGSAVVISTSTEYGAPYVQIRFADFNPTAAGILVGDLCTISGYCHPFMEAGGVHELTTAQIDPVRQIPTQDGRWDLSIFGRPPEDGTLGLTRALAHDSLYTWLGVDNKIYRYDETTDTYTLWVTLSPATLLTRRAFYDIVTGNVVFFAWADVTASGTATGYIFEITPATPSGQTWTISNAVATVPNLFPGDRIIRRGVQSSPTVRHIGIPPSGTGTGQINMPLFPAQDVYFFGLMQTSGDSYRLTKYLKQETTDPDQAIPDTAPYRCSTANPWTYMSVQSAWNGTPWYAASHIGGSYQICFISGMIYFWTFASSTFVIRSYNCTTRTVSLVYDTSSYNCPAALWKRGSYLYWITNDFGTDLSYTQNRITCRYYYGGYAYLLWQSPVSDPRFEGYLFIGGASAIGHGGIGCIMAAQDPYDSTYAANPYHKKFLLVHNMESNFFWTNLEGGGSSFIYASRNPFIGFTCNEDSQRSWFIHYGYNRLWTTESDGTVGRLLDKAVVPGDMALASQLCVTVEANPRVLGVSCGDFPDLRPGVADPGKCYLWQLAPWLTPRVELADFSGLSRYEALSQIAELADFVTRFDESGNFIFKKRSDTTPGTATVTIDGNATVLKVTKRRDRKNFCNRVECRAMVPTLGKPDVRYVPVRFLEATGEAVEFNGTIEVRQAGTDCRRVVLTCVVGNYAEQGSSAYDARHMDGTYWLASSGGEYLNAGVAIPYPVDSGGNSCWWRMSDSDSDWGVMVKLTPSPDDAIGFTAGDTIEITCPGLEMVEAKDGKVYAEDIDSISLRRVRSYQINNQLLVASRALDLCKFLLGRLGQEAIELEVESELYTPYLPLTVAEFANTRLRVDSTFLIQRTEHRILSSGISVLGLREWPAVTAPTVDDYPDPVIPIAEPA